MSLNRYQAEFGKWSMTMQMALTGVMAYRLNFILQVFGPAIVYFLIKVNLWKAVYSSATGDSIGQYSLQEMLNYQSWTFLISVIVHGFNSQNLAEDIRLGKISAYLIYPFSFWKFHAAKFMALLGLQVLIASASLLALRATGILTEWSGPQLLFGLGLSLCVSFLWFNIQFILGIVAFWLEETWVLRVMFMLIASFFSGALIPLDLFPAWLREGLAFTVFPYLTFVPVQVFMGLTPYPLGSMLFSLLAWSCVIAFVARYVWQRGLRHYSGAGM